MCRYHALTVLGPDVALFLPDRDESVERPVEDDAERRNVREIIASIMANHAAIVD